MSAAAGSLIAYVGSAVFHAAVHVAGHETYHKIKHKFAGHLLKNHDVSRALNEAYIAALAILERDFRRQTKSSDERSAAAAALKRLRGLASELFPAEAGPAALDEREAAHLTDDPSQADEVLAGLLQIGEPMPPSLRDLLATSFRNAFAFAFKEVGLKKNEKVRAVLQTELLHELRAGASLSGEKLDEIGSRLGQIATLLEEQENFRNFRQRFQESIEEGLREISGKIDEVAAGQREITGMLKEALAGTGPVVAYATIHDANGSVLERHPLHAKRITIGREKENEIQLSDGKVSGRHAEIRFEEGFIVLRDLKSTNGTFLEDNPQRIRQTMVNFGQKIRVGPFVIVLVSPDEAGDQPFLPPGTIPME